MASDGRRISGIWVPIGLDTSQVSKDIEKFSKELGELSTVATQIGKAMDGSLNPRNLNSGIMQINRSLGSLRDAAKAFDALRPGQQFAQALNALEPQLQKLAKTFGGTADQQRELYALMANTTAVNQQVTALNQLTRVLGTTRERTLELVRARGLMVSEAAARDFLGTNRLREANSLLASVTARFKELGAAFGVVGGVYGIANFAKGVVQASLKMENLNLAFQSIYGSAGVAQTQLKFVKETSDALGLSFTETADGAKRLFAASQGTVLEDKAESIYLAFSKMGTALKLSGQDMDGVFLAISQTISKGKVSAEELRQQLAERMPGAVTLFAKSIGVTTKELDKMLQDGAVGLEHFATFAEAVNEKYSAGAITASKGLQSEIARVSNSWFELKSSLADTDTIADAVRAVGSALKFLGDNSETVATVGANIGKWIALTAGIYGLAKAFGALRVAVAATGGAMASATSLWSKFAAALSGARFLSLAGVIGAVGVAILDVATKSSDGEKAFEKYSGEAYRLADSIGEAKSRFDELAEAAQANRLEGLRLDLEKTRKEFDSLFADKGGAGDSLATSFGVNMPGTSVIDDYIKSISGRFNFGQPEVKAILKDVELFAHQIHDQFTAALKENETANLYGFFYDSLPDLEDGIEKMGSILEQGKEKFAEFRNALRARGATDEQIEKFDKLTQAILASADAAQKSAQALKGTTEVVDDFAKLSDAADNAAGAITKLTKTSDAAHFNKATGEISTLVDHLITLSTYNIEAEKQFSRTGQTVAEFSESIRALKDSQEQLEEKMMLVASQAQKSGVDINTLANLFTQAADRAGFAQEEIARLQAQLRQGFELAAAQKLDNEILAVQTRIQTLRATTAQSQAISGLSKYFEDAAAASNYASAVMTGDQAKVREALAASGKDVEKLMTLYESYQKLGQGMDAGRGGGRSRSRSSGSGSSRVVTALQLEKKEMSEVAKAIDEVIKKTAELDNFDGHKALEFSKKFNADLEKINHTLEIGTGTETEKERLRQLVEQWKEAADRQEEYLANLDRLKDMQDRAKALSTGGGSNAFGRQKNMEYESPEAREGARANIRAQEETLLNDQKDAYDKGLISAEEYENNRVNIHRQANEAIGVVDGDFLSIFNQHLDDRIEKLKDWKDEVSETFTDFFESGANALADFALSGAQDFESLQEAFSDMVKSMLKDLTALFAKMVVFGMIKKIFGSMMGGGSGISSGAADYLDALNDAGFDLFSAKGNVFSSISGFSNQIVTKPTVFSGNYMPFARGGKIMGEAGPEAVMPLVRMADGNLGVRAGEGAATDDEVQYAPQISQAININVHNNAGAQVQANQSTDNQGNVDIEVMIEKSVAKSLATSGTAPFRVMQSTWQGSPALVNR